jgi:N-acetylglucosaminyldiphosphoundecaprenol N-acetyl-beta-D-mannosaminyltransferase
MSARRAGQALAFPAARLLGVRLDLISLHDLLSAVTNAVRRGTRLTVMYVNVHCMNVAAADPHYAGILERADIVYCDGTGVKLAAALLGVRVPQRMTGADWIHDLARRAVEEDLSLFLLGGAPGSAADAGARLLADYPGLRVAGMLPGYDLGPHTLDSIRAARPDILLVGMGTPTQEAWVDQNRQELDVPVVWAVGALFDFVGGRLRRGPAWMTEHGLEWLCRLVVEPRKLWRRYIFGNPRFMARVVRAWLLESLS